MHSRRARWCLHLAACLISLILAFVTPHALAADLFYIVQRSASLCAEHDSLVVPIALPIAGPTLGEGEVISAAFTLRATHPSVEVHPCGAPWTEWCCCDDTDCPSPCPPADTPCSTCSGSAGGPHGGSGGGENAATLIFETADASDQVYVLDTPSDIGSFEVIVNGISHGTHPGIVLGSRWDLEDSWPQDVVIYDNGFTRWKPRGEAPGSPTDPCFGTSVVLGPLHLAPPFLADGYSPSPLRHPSIDTVELTVDDGWSARLIGTLDQGGFPVMDVVWDIERTGLNSTQLVASVALTATATTDVTLYSIRGTYGLGLAELSSMYVTGDKHDADTLIGPLTSIPIGTVSTSNMGNWGQEMSTHTLQPSGSVRLETSLPTTHNTGAPALWFESDNAGIVRNIDPCWCADRIAFMSDRDGDWEIYAMDDNLTGETRLTDSLGDDLYPAWSPDCQRIAFVSNRDASYRLYVMDADGTNQQVITGDLCSCTARIEGASRPSWSPAGYPGGPWIAFAMQEATDDCRYGIHRVHPNGSGLERISSDPFGSSHDIDASWSPLDDTIVYTTNRSGQWCLAKLSAETGQGPGGNDFLCPGFGQYSRRYAQAAVAGDGARVAYTDFYRDRIDLTDLAGTAPAPLVAGWHADRLRRRCRDRAHDALVARRLRRHDARRCRLRRHLLRGRVHGRVRRHRRVGRGVRTGRAG